MATVFAWNPDQARIPKGQRGGGRWVAVAGEVLKGLEAYRLMTPEDINNIPQPITDPVDYIYDEDPITGELIEEPVYEERGGENDPYFSMTPDTRPENLQEESAQAQMAYMSDVPHHLISTNLRNGTIPENQPAATVFDGPGAGTQTYFGHRESITIQPSLEWMAPPDVTVRGDGSGVVAAIDATMSFNVTKDTFRIYRGMAVEDPEAFHNGMRWKDPAYTSTTLEPGIAMEFAKLRAGLPNAFSEENVLRDVTRDGYPFLLEIIVPQGVHFMPGAPSVKELVLERGLTFEVVDTTRFPGEMVTVIASPSGTVDSGK